VTPKVPSRRWRPARPAIWPSSAGEVAELVAVELAVLREGDVVDIEIEAHADGVGGDQVVDVAGLVERDLRVAGARAERPEHDRRAAALAADQLGDGVDLVGREGDDGRAARQARQLLRTGIGEMRQARPGDDGNALQQLLQNAAHGRRAEQQRLLPAAQMQDAVGEDMAALEIAGELHLVDGDEGGIRLARHGLDRADRIARAGRHDLSPRR
jgi:methionine aminopeptidase